MQDIIKEVIEKIFDLAKNSKDEKVLIQSAMEIVKRADV